jgi:hypothetical protein
MKILIGNCDKVIDCDLLIDQVKQHTVEPYHGNMTLDPADQFYEDHLKQKELYNQAGYSADTVEFRHYYAGKHFDQSIADKFGEFVRAKPLLCFVSEIRPGKCAPWHWDINPWLGEQQQLGEIVRYVCFINKPKPGHIFVIEKECFYWELQGSVYQYPSLNSWHAGSNVGLESKFLLTFTGYQYEPK